MEWKIAQLSHLSNCRKVLNFRQFITFLFFLSPSQDIFKQATEDRLTSANELPYFEGDFWPNVLEESIKELEQEEEERKKEENTAACETPEVWVLSQDLTLHFMVLQYSFVHFILEKSLFLIELFLLLA